MSRRRRRRGAPAGGRGLFALAGAAGAVALIDVAFLEGRAALNLYVVPVLVGAATLGRRGGIYAGVIAVGVVGGASLLQKELPAAPLDLFVWIAALTATAWVVGSLQDRRRARRRALREAHQAIRDLLARLVTTCGQPTEGHAWRVSEHAVALGRELSLSAEELEAVRAAGWLHELGESEATLEALKRAAGAETESAHGGFLERVIEIIAYRHERWDGNGHHEMKGDEIPLPARILAIADAWEAAVERSAPERTRAMIEVDVAGVLRRDSGKLFDPDVVETFLRIQYRRGRSVA